MPPALSNKGLATILSVASGLAWAGPTVSGPYEGAPYGQVRFHTEGDRVIGTATGGPCGFQPGTEVISGELEGNVLAAHVLLCQVGPRCEERELHPALIIINPRDGVLSAMIRLREGCSSPALRENALVLKAVAPADAAGQDEEAAPDLKVARPPVPGAPATAAPDAGAQASATNRPPEVPSVEEGKRQLAAGNHAAAQAHFRSVLDKEPRNPDPAALVGLAASQLGLGQVSQALKTLGSAPSTRPDVHLWLAYAHLKDGRRARARDSLRKAMELGWAPGNRPAEAVPEQALRAEIQLLLKERNRKRGALRESTGSGSTTP